MSLILFILGLFLIAGWGESKAIFGVLWDAIVPPERTLRYARVALGVLVIVAAGAATLLSAPAPPAPPPVSGGGAYVLKGTSSEVIAAVRALQKAKGVHVDGVVGPETCPLIYKRCPVI